MLSLSLRLCFCHGDGGKIASSLIPVLNHSDVWSCSYSSSFGTLSHCLNVVHSHSSFFSFFPSHSISLGRFPPSSFLFFLQIFSLKLNIIPSLSLSLDARHPISVSLSLSLSHSVSLDLCASVSAPILLSFIVLNVPLSLYPFRYPSLTPLCMSLSHSFGFSFALAPSLLPHGNINTGEILRYKDNKVSNHIQILGVKTAL